MYNKKKRCYYIEKSLRFGVIMKSEYIEQVIWDTIFSKKIANNKSSNKRPQLYGKLLSDDTIEILNEVLNNNNYISVLEAGCGSAKKTFNLALSNPNVNQITALDISVQALNYARQITPDALKNKTKYVQGSIMNMPFRAKSFDLVWNSGVVEHYSEPEIKKIVKEMFRVTKKGGYIVIAIPNMKNIAVIKAAFLGLPLCRKHLKFIKGYRNTTENLYKDKTIKNILKSTLQRDVILKYAGGTGLIGAPDFIIKSLYKFSKNSRFSFMSFFIVKK